MNGRIKNEYYVGNISSIIKKTNDLIDYCRSKKYKIIFTRHIEKGSNCEFALNSKNSEIISKLHIKESDIVIKKNKINPFYKTNLEEELKGIKKIITCGILTNLCVRSLVECAYDREFDITIIPDCCKAFDTKTHEFTIKDLKATREEIHVLNLSQFIS